MPKKEYNKNPQNLSEVENIKAINEEITNFLETQLIQKDQQITDLSTKINGSKRHSLNPSNPDVETLQEQELASKGNGTPLTKEEIITASQGYGMKTELQNTKNKLGSYSCLIILTLLWVINWVRNKLKS